MKTSVDHVKRVPATYVEVYDVGENNVLDFMPAENQSQTFCATIPY